MNHLLRELAPFGPDAWAMLDAEARDRLVPALTARRVVDFDGPYGWQRSAVDLGRTETIDGTPGISARRRRVLPLCEVRAEFTVRVEEMVDFSRGATDVDLGALDQAALRIAALENEAVLRGWAAGGVVGVGGATTQPTQPHDGTAESIRIAVTNAVAALRDAGVDGPYSFACSPLDWAAIVENDDAGYPLRKQIEGIIGGHVERAPGIEESVVISLRGGDFELTIGEDLTLGYLHHDRDDVSLYVEETFAFKVNTPEAAVRVVRTL